MGLKPPSISPGLIPNPRMLEQPGHGLHFGRSGTIRRIRCTFGSSTTSFHLSSRCGTWVVHWSLWFLEVSPWSILIDCGTGDDWSILESSCGSVCEGIHSMDGKEVLAPDTSFTRTEGTPTWNQHRGCDMNWYAQSSSLGGLHCFGWNDPYHGRSIKSQRHNLIWFHFVPWNPAVLSWADAVMRQLHFQVRLQVRLRDLQVAILAESAKHAPLAPCHQWSSRGLTV